LNGVGVNVTGLNSTGGGTGFELTMQAMFTGIYTFHDTKTINFDVTGGSAALYLIQHPITVLPVIQDFPVLTFTHRHY